MSKDLLLNVYKIYVSDDIYTKNPIFKIDIANLLMNLSSLLKQLIILE